MSSPPSNPTDVDVRVCVVEAPPNPTAPLPHTPSLQSSTTHSANGEFSMSFDSNKAGLDKVDAVRAAAIIEEASKGSSFYINEQRKAEARQKHVQQLRQKQAHFMQTMSGEKNASNRQPLERKVAKIEEELEAHRHFGNYVHVDMDMFYAAVEMKKNPSLASVPLGVGGASMLSTTNYVARQYGVRSGMPGFIGRKLCPALVIVPPDFASYRAEAAAVRGIAAEYDAHFASVGLDELTMELSAHLRRRGGTAAEVAAEFRARVLAATGLTASAGIAPTATLAKIASNYNKPNGQHELRLRNREEVVRFVRDLHVRTVPGIGPVQATALAALGIHTCGALLRQKCLLRHLFPDKTFRFYLAAGLGLSGTHADRQRDDGTPKSVGHEETFSKPARSEAELRDRTMQCAITAHDALLQEGVTARRVMLRLKRRSFQELQRSATLPETTNDFTTLWHAVRELLRPHITNYGDFRLVGVRLCELQPTWQRQRRMAARRTSALPQVNRTVRDAVVMRRKRLVTKGELFVIHV